MLFEVSGWHKHAEKDDFQNGCDPKSAFDYVGRDRFSASTVKELISMLMDFVGTNSMDCVSLNACEEEGRVDIQQLENAQSFPASTTEIEAWKQGKINLYLCDYTFYVEKVTRETVEISIEEN